MDGGPPWRRRAARSGWPRIRPAATAVGTLLTLLTMVLCICNAISVQQAIGLALPSATTTLGGWISMIVPDAWISWRRGFQQGCNAAMADQMAQVLANARAEAISSGSDEPSVIDLVARSGTRSGRRTQPSDRY
jgi:hypothetical protein